MSLEPVRRPVALVTGAAVGIGRAIALALLAEGMDTWLADVQDPEGPEGRFVRLDVTDDAPLRRLIAEAKPEVLVNNAGGIPAGRSDVEILDLNLRSALVATTLAVEHGAQAVVNIASVAGMETIPHRSPAYAAAKAELIRFTTAYDGPARVNCIVPGWIATPRGLREAAAMTDAERAAAGPMVSMESITAAVSDLLGRHGARPRRRAAMTSPPERAILPPMPDVSYTGIDELSPVEFLEGFTFRRVGAELGVTPFGMSIIDMPPETTDYPAHDHSSEGPGNPPAHQLGQEEVYIALRGSADVEVDGHRYPLDADHIIRVGPTARRKILPGPDGVRLLAVGGVPGQAYDPASTA